MSESEWLVHIDNRLSQMYGGVSTTVSGTTVNDNSSTITGLPVSKKSPTTSKDEKFLLRKGGNPHIFDKLQNLRKTLKEKNDDEQQMSAKRIFYVNKRLDTVLECYTRIQDRILVEAKNRAASMDKLSNFITTVGSSLQSEKIEETDDEFNKLDNKLKLLSVKIGMLEKLVDECKCRSEASEVQRQKQSLSYKDKLAEMYNLVSRYRENNINGEALFAEEVVMQPLQVTMRKLLVESEDRKSAVKHLREKMIFWSKGSAFQDHIRVAESSSKPRELSSSPSKITLPTSDTFSLHRHSDELTDFGNRKDIFSVIERLTQTVTQDINERTANHAALLDTVNAAKMKVLSG